MFPVYNTPERETFAFAESMSILRTASIGLVTKKLGAVRNVQIHVTYQIGMMLYSYQYYLITVHIDLAALAITILLHSSL
jgi:hypothetical protein